MQSNVDKIREKTFKNIGRDLFLSGAITSHGGNLSMSDGTTIWITRTGSQLGRLEKGDVIATTWEASDSDKNCSSELVVHRELYHAMKRKLDSQGLPFGQWAVLHAHTTHTALRSMYYDQLEPLDSECKLLIPYAVQVVRPKVAIGSPEAASMLGKLVEQEQNIGVIGGHGPFCIAPTLGQALQLVSSLEHTCILSDLVDQKTAMGIKLPNAQQNQQAQAAANAKAQVADAAKAVGDAVSAVGDVARSSLGVTIDAVASAVSAMRDSVVATVQANSQSASRATDDAADEDPIEVAAEVVGDAADATGVDADVSTGAKAEPADSTGVADAAIGDMTDAQDAVTDAAADAQDAAADDAADVQDAATDSAETAEVTDAQDAAADVVADDQLDAADAVGDDTPPSQS